MKSKFYKFSALIAAAAMLCLSGCSRPGSISDDSGIERSTLDHLTIPEASDTAPKPQESETGTVSDTFDPSVSSVTGFSDDILAKAQAILDTMSLEDKVGQMFLVRCPETDGAGQAGTWHPGGYILFGRDFENKTKDQVIADISGYQSASTVPMFIAVDEEGGTVNRVSTNKELRLYPFWSPQELFAEGGLELIAGDTLEKSLLLKSLGINMNLAPVCDVSTDSSDFIYRRAFGQDASGTAEYVKTVVKTMNENKIASALKHFPGYGSNSDTHTGIAQDTRSYETFTGSDFLPFIAGIQENATAVLVSHTIVQSMDANAPASLSAAVHDILRNELGFNGIIMTDDLSMEAITQSIGSSADAAVAAVLAGNDLLCTTDYEQQIPAVIDAVNAGAISEARVNQSVLRILASKLELGIIQQ